MKGTVKVTLERYAYPRVSHTFEVPAYIVGDLAIHRFLFWGDGEPDIEKVQVKRAGSGWDVTHIPTGLNASSPVRSSTVLRKRVSALAWAERWQALAPWYFDLARGGETELLRANPGDVQRAIDAAQRAASEIEQERGGISARSKESGS